MAKPAIVIVQSFSYRSAPEEFSNKYHFAGPAPGDDASWLTLANALVAVAKACFSAKTTFVRAYGYNDGDKPSIWSHDWTVPGPPVAGTLLPGSSPEFPGDVAATVRWDTPKRNSKGKHVYARKYFHDIYGQGSSEPDRLSAGQSTAMLAFARSCVDGTVSSVFHLCLPDGSPASNPAVAYYTTTRTLKRRGKRPPT